MQSAHQVMLQSLFLIFQTFGLEAKGAEPTQRQQQITSKYNKPQIQLLQSATVYQLEKSASRLLLGVRGQGKFVLQVEWDASELQGWI